jgi:hypothetical protein
MNKPLKSVSVFFVTVGLLSALFPLTIGEAACDCSSCGGLFGDNCSWGAPTTIQTGNTYYLQTQCDKLCNGPSDTNTKTCSVNVQTTNDQSYKLSGSINASFFGLSGDWQSQTTNVKGCSTSDSCNTPNCCVGPLYGYLSYSYVEKAQWYHNDTKGCWCCPCGSYAQTGYLESSPVTLCTGTQHASIEPALMTVAQYCASNAALCP